MFEWGSTRTNSAGETPHKRKTHKTWARAGSMCGAKKQQTKAGELKKNGSRLYCQHSALSSTHSLFMIFFCRSLKDGRRKKRQQNRRQVVLGLLLLLLGQACGKKGVWNWNRNWIESGVSGGECPRRRESTHTVGGAHAQGRRTKMKKAQWDWIGVDERMLCK